MWMEATRMALLALTGHALADGFQGRLSRLKRRRGWSGREDNRFWWLYLAAHAGCHGALCALALGSWWPLLWESGAHALIDWGKCSGKYGTAADQGLHIACKGAWIWLLLSQT